MNKLISIFLFFLYSGLQSQVILDITSVPKDTPENARIFVASSLNSWNPNDPKFELKKNEWGNYSIEIPEGSGKAEYKFTRGSWETAEGDENGNGRENRVFHFNGKPQSLDNQILSWEKTQPKRNTASANVKILSENFWIPQLKTSRKIWIYLPENYATTKESYPVIYMEDGQNLFNESTSFSGEWKVDEAMDSLFTMGKRNAIIVGIENGGPERLNEYSAWNNAKYGGGKGELYADFLANTLKPFIDKTYRTLPKAKNTGLIGSSMGGLISFYTGMKYPDKFGKLGIFSPSFWFARNELMWFVEQNSTKIKKTKFYFLAGKKESPEMVSDVEEMVPLLIKKGVPEKNIHTKFDDYGTHSESYWSKEFPDAFLWLFP